MTRSSVGASPLSSLLARVAIASALVTLTAGCQACTKGGGAASDGGGAAADGGAANAAADAAEAAPAVVSLTDGGAVNALPIPAASVDAMLNPQKLPAYSGPTGSVEGTISVVGEPALAVTEDFSKCPAAAETWGHVFREGPPVDPAAGPTSKRPLADAVVVVTGYHGYFVPEKTEAKEIQIEGCAYKQRTLTMTFGQRLEVKNLAKDFWTPVLEPGSTMVLMMASPKGDPVRIYPKKPGHYLIGDRDRSYAFVDVYAFLHPLHATTSLTGTYRIDGVPVGKLKVSSMHPRFSGSAETEIEIQPGVVRKVDLVLKNTRKPDAGTEALDAGKDTKPAPNVH